MNYYRCIDCLRIPLIKQINDDKILIQCELHGDRKMKINDFINKCLYKYKCRYCDNIPMYLIDEKYFLCKNCSQEKPSDSKKIFLKNINCQKHCNLLIDYCLDCKESKCENCKKEDIKNNHNHNYLNEEIKNEKKKLEDILEKINDIIKKKENESYLYKCILLNKNSIIINNIQILNYIKNIQNKEKIFFEKMGEIITEFENYSDETNHNLNNFNLIYINAFDNNIEKQLFQKPENKLYQDFSIKLTNISNKNQYINQKIKEISNNIEDKINLEERDKFLISVAHIAREADNYSKELCEILIQRFYNEYKEFSSINYNNAKTELSSWVNQSLIKDESKDDIKDESNDDIKDLRCFYNYYCEKEKKRIQKYLNLDSKIEKILNIHNFNLQKLFRILSQLYTEVLLFSDKNIYLKYTEKCDFDHKIMNDITDLNGKRFVIFSVLPGLFVNEFNITSGEILVFCNKNKNFEINILNKYMLNLKNTITKIDINYSVNDNEYHIKIKCEPQIPDIENLKFKVFDSSKLIKSLDKQQTEFKLKEIYKNKSIYVAVERNGEIIKSNKLILK